MAVQTEGQGLYPMFVTRFSTNLELLLQQQDTCMRGKVDESTMTGAKLASPVNQAGAVSMKAPEGRYAPKKRTDTDFVRRWVAPIDKELDQLIDSFDELKTIVDPKSAYAMNAKNACNRAFDDEIFRACCADATIGADAGSLSTETFTTANFQIADTFGASSSVGLTVDKMKEARRILKHYHALENGERPWMAIGSQQDADLLGQVQVVSTEFNDRPVMQDGRVVRFMGFDLVDSERVPETTTGSIRGVLCGVKSGVHLGIWQDMTNRVSIRNDLSGEPYDLYTKVSFGATRKQLGKVVRILCADTTGADITP